MKWYSMKGIVTLVFVSSYFFLHCKPNETFDPKEYKVVKEAYQSGHLTVVQVILKERKKERELSFEERKLFMKSLFYLSEWKDFFNEWKDLKEKTPELVLYYFKAINLSNENQQVNVSEEQSLVELMPISPEACLVYLQWKKNVRNPSQIKLFRAQTKQFKTLLDRMEKELDHNL